MRPGDSCIDHLSQSITLIKALQPPREEIFVAGQAKFRRADPGHPVREGSVCAWTRVRPQEFASRQINRGGIAQLNHRNGVVIAIGLYIRLGILETPAFRRIVAENRVERVPVIEVIKRQPRSIILSALARMAEQAPAYIYLAFTFACGTQVIHQDRDFLLTSLICAGIVSLATIPLAGHLSDRIGRKRMYLIGSVLTGLFGFAYFGLLNTGVPELIFIAIVCPSYRTT